MAHLVTLIPGDGIGPEVSQAARRAVDATGVGPRPAYSDLESLKEISGAGV